MNQRVRKQGINVGFGMCQVAPVAYWYKYGHFKNEDEARGAFELAYQQGLDGMGKSIWEWMGLTEEEFAEWHNNGKMPERNYVKSA